MFSAATSDLEARMQSRQKAFMQAPDFTDLKKRRDEHNAELRRAKRTETAQKRRNLTIAHTSAVPERNFTVADLPSIREAAARGTDADLLFAATAIRKILTLKVDPPIQEVVDAGLVPALLQWLKREDQQLLQYESCWALTNISSGSHDHAAALVAKGVIPQIYELMKSTSEEVREQAVWLLGNLAGDSQNLRDAVLQSNGLPQLLSVFTTTRKPSLVTTAAWAVSNAVRGTPAPPTALVFPALPYLCELVRTQSDAQTVRDCLWALSSMCEGSPDCVNAALASGVLPKLVSLAASADSRTQHPALRCVANAVSGTEEQTQKVVDAGFVPVLKTLLKSEKAAIRKEAAWTVSNLAAGNTAQVQSLVYGDVFATVVSTLSTEPPIVQKELLIALLNAVLSESPDVPLHLFQIGTLSVLGDLLDSKTAKIVYHALDTIRGFLESGKKHFAADGSNRVSADIEARGILEKIERLQQHPNQQVYKKAHSIIKSFFELAQPADDLIASILEIPHYQL